MLETKKNIEIRTDGGTAKAKAFVGFACSGEHKVDGTQKCSSNVIQVFKIGRRLYKKFKTVVPE